jgi:hypothetical protein
VFHLDKSGKDSSDEQLEKRKLISVTLSIFHLDISGIVDNEEQLKNKFFILIKL